MQPDISRGFALVELLVALAIIALLASFALTALPALTARMERADALAKTRVMGTAVLQYTADHAGNLPPLFPGQVLEYEPGRGGRIVTECAAYLGIPADDEKFLVTSLLPRAYARQTVPAGLAQMRVWVMNSTVEIGGTMTNPFGTVTTPGQPPTGPLNLAAVPGQSSPWMLSTADQQQPNVATAPWRTNAPAEPPLGDRRAVFRFDGSADLINISPP